jgi:hypothetical protein
LSLLALKSAVGIVSVQRRYHVGARRTVNSSSDATFQAGLQRTIATSEPIQTKNGDTEVPPLITF